MSLSHIGVNTWAKGSKQSEETKKKIGRTLKKIGHSFPKPESEENHPKWRGDEVEYGGLHKWINKVLGKAKKCSKCGKEGTGREIHWANKDHKYRRNVEDFIELCISCHGEYDKKHNLRKRKK